ERASLPAWSQFHRGTLSASVVNNKPSRPASKSIAIVKAALRALPALGLFAERLSRTNNESG
ncbi:hypothetical protein ACNJD8_23060, partial [Mycobacterium tuberculosis]